MHFYCWFMKVGEALIALREEEEEEGEGEVVWLPATSVKQGLGILTITAAHARDPAEFSIPQVFLLFFFFLITS